MRSLILDLTEDGSSFWLSFCDASLPKGRQFLGAAIVRGQSMVHAVQRAHALGCNPGGEVVGHRILLSYEKRIEKGWRNRLMDRAECERIDTLMQRSFS